MNNKKCKCPSLFDGLIQKRIEFNKAFNLPLNQTPQTLTPHRSLLHYEMMKEELEEYMDNHTNLTEVADAVIDMQVVLLGIAAEHGLLNKFKDLYNEVHRSNMSKLDEDGNPIINGVKSVNGRYTLDEEKPRGKVLKSDNYFKPNLKKILDD